MAKTIFSPDWFSSGKKTWTRLGLGLLCLAVAAGCSSGAAAPTRSQAGRSSAVPNEDFLTLEKSRIEKFKLGASSDIARFKREAYALQANIPESPVKIGNYFYSLGEPPGQNSPILLRSAERSGPRQTVIDFNKLFKNSPGRSLGSLRPNLAGTVAAFTADLGDSAGRRLFRLNLKSGASPEFVAAGAHSFIFGADDQSLIFLGYDGRRPAIVSVSYRGESPVEILRSVEKSKWISLHKAADGGAIAVEAGPENSKVYFLEGLRASPTKYISLPGRIKDISARGFDDFWALSGDDLIFHAGLAQGGADLTIKPKDFAPKSLRAFEGGAAIFGRWGGEPLIMLAEKNSGGMKPARVPFKIGEVWPSEDATAADQLAFHFSSPDVPRADLILNTGDGSILPGQSAPANGPKTRIISCQSDSPGPGAVYRGPDKPRAVLINAYGAYGDSPSLKYDPTKAALEKLGIGTAYALVRGGGEYGEPWHRGGYGKKQSIEDLGRVAECLAAELPLSAERIFLKGSSAGGFLVLAAMLRSPANFGGVIADAPLTDLNLFDLRPDELNALIERDEWGLEVGARERLKIENCLRPDGCPPLLLEARLKDEIIPFDSIVQFARIFKHSGGRLFIEAEPEGRHASASLEREALEFAFIENTLKK